MKNFYITFALLFALNVSAQDSTYSKVFNHNSIEMEAYAADNTIDSGYVMVGRYAGSEALIVRLDSLSNIIWSKTMIGSAGQAKFTDVIATLDSGYVAVGINSMEVLCIKFNQYGDTIWTHTYDTGAWDGAYVTPTYDSSFVLTYASSQNSILSVVKIDQDGNTIWSSKLDGVATLPRTIRESTDSTLYIGGAIGWSTGVILKLNQDGQFLWAKELNIGEVQDVEFFQDSVFLMCADYSWGTPVVIKMDSAANVSWANRYPGYIDNSGFNLFIRSFLDEDSTLIFSAPTLMVGGNVLNRIDLSGNLLQSMAANLGSSDVLPAINKGAYLLGIGPVWGIKKVSHSHIGVIRTDSMLLEQNNWCISAGWDNNVTLTSPTLLDITYTDTGGLSVVHPLLIESIFNFQSVIECVDFIGGVDEHELELGVLVFPNSSDGIFNMEFESEGLVDVIIVDQLGRTIYSKTTNSSNLLIDLSEQKSGVYHYKVSEAKSGRAGTGKLILLK